MHTHAHTCTHTQEEVSTLKLRYGISATPSRDVTLLQGYKDDTCDSWQKLKHVQCGVDKWLKVFVYIHVCICEHMHFDFVWHLQCGVDKWLKVCMHMHVSTYVYTYMFMDCVEKLVSFAHVVVHTCM
jgi:hypothetical protein